MKKSMCLILLLTIVMSGWSQELHIASGGTMYISPKSYVYVGNNISSSGNLTVKSDATDSASLLVTGTATGDITYDRYVPSTNWHFVSAPVTSQDIGDFVTNANNAVRTSATGNYGVSFYKNDNAKGERWEYYTIAAGPLGASTAGNFISGKGYSNLRAAAGTYTFTGQMATDSQVAITIPANPITPDVSTNHLWSVVGNPYPSFLPANDGANSTNNILKQNIANLDPSFAYLQFWNGSAYEIINHASDALFIAPGQAFMVDPSGNNISFVFPENLLVPQPEATATFYKTNAKPSITLHLKSGKNSGTTKIKYLDNATTGLDVGYDAGTYVDVQPELAIDTHLVSDSEGINFTLQCLPTNQYEVLVVPVSVKAAAYKTLSFNAETLGLPEGLKVYLEDRETNTFTQIDTTSYQVTLETPLTGIGRFYLHTTTNVLSTGDDAFLNANLKMYTTSATNLRITSAKIEGKASLTIYSIGGKEVLFTSFKMKSTNNVTLPNNLAKGVYLVNLVTDNLTSSRKIILE